MPKKNTAFSDQIDKNWSLFLDRDGVINRRLHGDYIRNWEQFEFIPGVLKSMAVFSEIFHKIIIVTNQQGVGKGLMNVSQLEAIHQKMLDEIACTGGRVDAIMFCTKLHGETPNCRKPDADMALKAREQFPSIAFDKSIMVGDSESDIIFGARLDMKTIWIADKEEMDWQNEDIMPDLRLNSLVALKNILIQKLNNTLNTKQ